MTGDGMCGVFIPDRVLAGWWRSQWNVSDRMGAGRCTTGCGRGQVYKCECGWEAWSGPEGSRKLRFPEYVTMAQGGGKVVSLTHRPPLPPGNAPGTYFC